MDFYARYAITPREHPVIGLLSPEKLLGIAQFAGLDANSCVIEFGCGYGEDLLNVSEHFGVSGVGIDANEVHIERAKEVAARSPLGRRLEYVCGDAVQYDFEPGSFDLAACINSTNMFGEGDAVVANTIRHLQRAIHADGCLLIAQPYYTTPDVPQELLAYEGALPTEVHLLDSIRDEGYELVYMVHSDRADWDRYISSNLYHTSKWLKANRDHPDWEQKRQGRFLDMYVRYRQHFQESVALLMTRIA